MDYSLYIENASALKKVFKMAPVIANEEYKKSLERIALKVVQVAQLNAPVGKYKGGGNLRQSIRYKPYGSNAYLVWVNADYGRYVEEGTRPHVIVPRRAPRLAFQKDGKWVFAKRVNHPGTKAQPFFGPAVDEANRYANVEMSAAMDRVLNRL